MIGDLAPQNNIESVICETDKLFSIIDANLIEDIRIKQTLAAYALSEEWSKLWKIADRLKREVSILFDYDFKIWVDIGTIGKVVLSPPLGAKIPFQMWIHTHPYNAYWSETDLDTLACNTYLLDKAIVLGHDHFKETRKTFEITGKTLGKDGPLGSWTDEQIKNYNGSEL